MDRCSPARPNQWAANLRIVGYAASPARPISLMLHRPYPMEPRIQAVGAQPTRAAKDAVGSWRGKPWTVSHTVPISWSTCLSARRRVRRWAGRRVGYSSIAAPSGHRTRRRRTTTEGLAVHSRTNAGRGGDTLQHLFVSNIAKLRMAAYACNAPRQDNPNKLLEAQGLPGCPARGKLKRPCLFQHTCAIQSWRVGPSTWRAVTH